MFTTETEIEAHVKTDHSQTISNCNKCHETFNSQAFQEEHTSRITNVFTICDQIEPFNERPCHCVHNVLQENCKQEDLKRHMTLGAAKGNIDAKFLVW